MRAKNEDTKIRIYEYINEYIKNNRVTHISTNGSDVRILSPSKIGGCWARLSHI